MGFATVVLFFCRFLPSWAILASGAGLVAVMPLLRDMVDFTVFCGNELVNAPVISRFVPGILVEPVSGYKIIWSFKRIAQGFLFYGNFPVLPWLMFPPLGFVIGRLIVQGKMRRWVYNLTSRFSLTFYCMHYMLIRWTIYAVYLVTGRFLSSDLMSAIPALTCGVAGVLFLELIIYYWQKAGGKYSLEWILGALTFKLMPSPRGGASRGFRKPRARAEVRTIDCRTLTIRVHRRWSAGIESSQAIRGFYGRLKSDMFDATCV